MLPGIVCFLVGLLFELEMGIFSGIGTHLVILLYHTARPGVAVEVKQVICSHKESYWVADKQEVVYAKKSLFISEFCTIFGAPSGT